MRIAILQFIESNCDQQLLAVLESLNISLLKMQSLADLADADGYVILDPLLDEALLGKLQTLSQDKFFLSFGLGAKTLLAAGLLPGTVQLASCMTLSHRHPLQTFMRFKPLYNLNAFTQNLSLKDIIKIDDQPVKFEIPLALSLELFNQGLDVFYGCNADGQALDDTPLGLNNKTGNVLALLPSMIDPAALRKIFQGLLKPYLGRIFQPAEPLSYEFRT